jgi:hypothetical protein
MGYKTGVEKQLVRRNYDVMITLLLKELALIILTIVPCSNLVSDYDLAS